MSDRAHPSEVPGVTEDYRAFIQTWARHCGAPKSVFVGHTNALIAAELHAAGEEVVRYAQEAARTNRLHWKAISRLLTDVSDHLAAHDCYLAACPSRMGPDDLICPARAALVDRITRARTVLGLDGEPRSEDGA